MQIGRSGDHLRGVNPTGSQDELQDPGLVRDRSFLPVRAKGLGLTRTADIAHSAFCGAIELVLPRFPEATDEHGIPVLGSGLFFNLVAVVGTTSLEKKSFILVG